MPELIFCLVYGIVLSFYFNRKYSKLLKKYKILRRLFLMNAIELNAHQIADKEIEMEKDLDAIFGEKSK